jgi:outer membrane protein assembly factor BamB
MYKISRNTLEINSKEIVFDYNIYQTLEIGDVVVVLLDYVNASRFPINNVFAYNQKGERIWQIQDAREIYLERRDPNLYVGITLYEHGKLSATTYLGIVYFINPENGKILGSIFTK